MTPTIGRGSPCSRIVSPRGHGSLRWGAGPGSWASSSLRKGVRVTGLDFSEVALRRARAKGVDAVACDPDAEPFPFLDRTFEWCASNSSLEHLIAPDRALAEIARILEPGGTFLWMVPNVGHWRFRLWLLFGRFPEVPDSPTDFLHLRMYTRHDAAKALARHGFALRRVTGSAGTWVPKLYPWFLRAPGPRHVYERLAPFWPSLLCRYLVLEARKS